MNAYIFKLQFLLYSELNFDVSRNIVDNAAHIMYVAHMKTIMEENLENGLYETRALEIQDIIDADVQADPNKFYSYANFIGNINSAVGGGPPPSGQVIGITQLMEARINYIAGLSDFQAQAPEISTVSTSPSGTTTF